MRFWMGLSIGLFIQGVFLVASGLILSNGANLFWMGFASGVAAMALVTAAMGISAYYGVKAFVDQGREKEPEKVDEQEEEEVVDEEGEVNLRIPTRLLLRSLRTERQSKPVVTDPKWRVYRSRIYGK